jgi:DNA-binding transcriptional ArsR family regulator
VVKYNEGGLSATFGALSDPTRRRILSMIGRTPGITVGKVADHLDVKGPGLSKHLDVLADAGLIKRTKCGRFIEMHLNPAALKSAMGWLGHYEEFWTGSLRKLQRHLEDDS